MHNSNAPPLPPDIRQEEPAPLSHWLAAFDLAALEATTDWMHRLAGGHLLALNWANRLLLVTSPLKLGVPVLLALHAWLRPETGYRADPLRALRSIGGVVLAMAISRVAQDLLPARPRPRLALPDFPFPPLGHLSALADWSSMPSDHAALAFALAAVAWTGSRGLGLVAGVWAALFASLPRLYFGYHYASDLIAGAVLGVVSVAVAMHVPLPRGLALRIEGWAHLLEARPHPGAAGLLRVRLRMPDAVPVHPGHGHCHGRGGAGRAEPRQGPARTAAACPGCPPGGCARRPGGVTPA